MIVNVSNCIPFFLSIILNFLLVVGQSSDECSICKDNAKLINTIERFDIFQAKIKSENEDLKAQLSQQSEKILLLEKEISRLQSSNVTPKPTDSCKRNVDKAASQNNKKPSSPRALVLPTSCQELRSKGHFADGVYLVLNEETNKIHALLCRFPGAKQVHEAFIGAVDLKTQRVHFNVQRDSSLDSSTSISTCGGCIPFEIEVQNIGGAIDIDTGFFTAPVTGTYQFQFSAMGENNLQFRFYKSGLNSQMVAAPYVIGSAPVSFTASLRLEQGEQMIFEMVKGAFSTGIGGPSILYSGWLVEEELQLS